MLTVKRSPCIKVLTPRGDGPRLVVDSRKRSWHNLRTVRCLARLSLHVVQPAWLRRLPSGCAWVPCLSLGALAVVACAGQPPRRADQPADGPRSAEEQGNSGGLAEEGASSGASRQPVGDASADPQTSASPVDPQLKSCSTFAEDPAWPYPQTVQQAVDRINALPQPVTLPCFLASLPRPLALVATVSVTSAQPAAGERSPRIFLMHPALILSVVPDGVGQALLEFGEFRDETRTLKAELEFPVSESLTPQSPFARLRHNDQLTTCGFCHRSEEPAEEDLPFATTSEAIAPHWSADVPLAALLDEYARCDVQEEPGRCAIFAGLFAFGPVEEGAFPEQIMGFF